VPSRGIVCYPCIRRELGAHRCPYCGIGLRSHAGGILLCPSCERGFRDADSKAKNPPKKKTKPASALSKTAKEKALSIYEDFSFQQPKKGWLKNKYSMPSKKNPLVWLGVMSECVYISDKEGEIDNITDDEGNIVDGQHYVHTLKPPFPEILITADRKTLVVPLEFVDEHGHVCKTSLRIEDGWMREWDE
jgi:uncharacterized Zn finger protein (UPF0148 family)